MSTIKINIVSSSEEIYSGEATMVYATGTLGELGIAPGHRIEKSKTKQKVNKTCTKI